MPADKLFIKLRSPYSINAERVLGTIVQHYPSLNFVVFYFISCNTPVYDSIGAEYTVNFLMSDSEEKSVSQNILLLTHVFSRIDGIIVKFAPYFYFLQEFNFN